MISEIIKKLQEIKAEHGDIVVFTRGHMLDEYDIEVVKAEDLDGVRDLPWGVKSHDNVASI